MLHWKKHLVYIDWKVVTPLLKLGLKCSFYPEQLQERLKYHPEIIELHLFDEDLFGAKRKRLEDTVSMLLAQGCTVYLHHPVKYRGRYLNIIHEREEDYLFYHLTTRILAEICSSHAIKCVIHPHYVPTDSTSLLQENTDRMVTEIERILEYGNDAFLWENSIFGLFTAQNPRWLDDFVVPLDLPLVYDISHAFISFKGDNRLLLEHLKKFDSYIHYFHVVDSMGQTHDGLPLGTGLVDWKPIIPFLTNRPYIYEISLKNQTDAREMVQSHEYLINLADQ